jgi:hypothetical protein
MKNILLIVTTILALMCFAFGYVQKLEADRQRELAIILKTQAEQAELKAVQQQELAEAARAEAEKQRILAMEAISACEKNKKK